MGLHYYDTSKTLSQVIIYEMRCFPSSKKKKKIHEGICQSLWIKVFPLISKVLKSLIEFFIGPLAYIPRFSIFSGHSPVSMSL